MSDFYVKFWSDSDRHDDAGDGPYKVYTSPTNITNLEDVKWDNTSHDDDMKDDMTWVNTGSSSWVRIYTEPNYGGHQMLIGPNQSVNLKIQLYDGKNSFNDDVESVQMFDREPVDVSSVISNFHDLYPGSSYGSLHGLWNNEWYAQDSQYRVYDPTIVQTGDRLDFTIQLDHVQSEHDDHATVTFSMDDKGAFVDKITVSYDMADASQIPDWAVNLIDDAIDVASDAAKAVCDGAEIVITDGVGVVATVETDKLIDYTADAITFCIDHLNTVLSAIFKYQDNGGTMYFSSIVSHSIARLVQAYYTELFGADHNRKLTFNDSSFYTWLGASAWINPGDDGGKSNPYVNFTANTFSYRAFYPDNSFLYATGGAVSSVCIGANTGLQKDDHLTMQVGLDPHGNLFTVVGGMDLFLTRSIDGYVAPSTGVIMKQGNQFMHIQPNSGAVPIMNAPTIQDAYRDLMYSALNSTAEQFSLDLSDQQKRLVDASVEVLNAIDNAIS